VVQLDGLRGIAVLLVLWGHAWVGVYPAYRRLIPGTTSPSGGGMVGVQLFFVLSGYLITSLLVHEHATTGHISLRAFYGRRARRLLPALFTVTGLYTIYALATSSGKSLSGALGSVATALTYTRDLGPLVAWVPSNGWLDHTWSLALEEQFYLVWPVLLIFFLRRRRRALIAAAATVMLAGIAFRAFLAASGNSEYMDVQWDALMAGCLLAICPLPMPRYAGRIAAVCIGAMALGYPRTGSATCTLATFACAVALASSLDARWLSSRVLVYFGGISYGLYLWHVLLLRFGWAPLPTLALSVLVADLSLRLIEQPLRRRRPPAPVVAYAEAS
jgi:peptidoglycan/LPS O-acetylase OafA/YrhL